MLGTHSGLLSRITIALTLAARGWAMEGQPPAGEVPTFGTTVVIASGLKGQIYFMRVGEAWLPDFSKLTPVGTIYTTVLNVVPQNWSTGFPGITKRNEWFAIDYAGRFWVQQPGEYEFSLTSDDGSKLYIDDHVVINLDGTHPPETEFGRVKLTCGVHRIRVSYFQGPRTFLGLVLNVSGGGKKWRLFSTEEFKPPPNPEDWKCSEGVLQETGASFEAEALKALNANPRREDFPVRTAVYHFRSDAAGSKSAIAVSVPSQSLTVTPVPRKKNLSHVHAAVFAELKGKGGESAGKLSIDMPYEIPTANLEALRAADLVFTHPMSLRSGPYTVQTAVIDQEARRVGTSVGTLVSPSREKGPGISSIVLVERVEPAGADAQSSDPFVHEGKRVVPRLAPDVNPASNPMVYFVVYPDAANPAKPTLRVQFLVDGQLLADQAAALPDADGSGEIRMMVGAVTRPGQCELRMSVVQGADSATESVKYSVR